MRRSWMFLLVVAPALLLQACAPRASTGGFGGGGARRTLTPEARLALGTIRLEGTPQAVDAAEAARLLPLWQLLSQLNSSNSAAPQEVTAVLDEIQSTMSGQQTAAIEGMQLSGADMFAAFQQQGQAGGGASRASGGNSSGGTNRNGGGQGFFFGGGGPPGGGGFGAGGVPGGSARTSSGTGSGTSGSTQASAAQRAAAFAKAADSALINQVIKLLESKIKAG